MIAVLVVRKKVDHRLGGVRAWGAAASTSFMVAVAEIV